MCLAFSLKETTDYLTPHHLKTKAAGKRVVMMPLVLFSDDTSGNHSKKWHKFESWYLQLAGLERHENARLENIHFVCCSDSVSPLDLSGPIAKELTLLETEGILVIDKLYQDVVLVIAPLMFIICDNPRASELLNHLGSNAMYGKLLSFSLKCGYKICCPFRPVEHNIQTLWVNCAPGKQPCSIFKQSNLRQLSRTRWS